MNPSFRAGFVQALDKVACGKTSPADDFLYKFLGKDARLTPVTPAERYELASSVSNPAVLHEVTPKF